MGKGPRRGHDIVVKTQFNIHGSRGKDVGHFISDYVARDAATDASLAYVPPTDRPMEQGDGVAFTLHEAAISKQKTLDLAAHVQELFERGDRAIEQMVISFSPDYLVEQAIVPEGVEVLGRGGYKYNYDDVRLRHAVMSGIHAMLENDGYYDGDFVAAIQSDTEHLHVHAVVYEDGCRYTRRHGREERGCLKRSSLNRLAHHVDRYMSATRDVSCVPTQRLLTPDWLDDGILLPAVELPEQTPFLDKYRLLLEEQEAEERLAEQVSDEEMERMAADALSTSPDEVHRVVS